MRIITSPTLIKTVRTRRFKGRLQLYQLLLSLSYVTSILSVKIYILRSLDKTGLGAELETSARLLVAQKSPKSGVARVQVRNRMMPREISGKCWISTVRHYRAHTCSRSSVNNYGFTVMAGFSGRHSHDARASARLY